MPEAIKASRLGSTVKPSHGDKDAHSEAPVSESSAEEKIDEPQKSRKPSSKKSAKTKKQSGNRVEFFTGDISSIHINKSLSEVETSALQKNKKSKLQARRPSKFRKSENIGFVGKANDSVESPSDVYGVKAKPSRNKQKRQ